MLPSRSALTQFEYRKMIRVFLVALFSAALLPACPGRLIGPAPAAAIGDPRSQSIGFTGIGPEPF